VLRDPNNAYLIKTADEMAVAVLDIMKKVIGTISNTQKTFNVSPFNGLATLKIPPYVRQLKLNLFITKPRPAANSSPLMTISRPNKMVAVPSDKDVLISGTTPNIETWSFDRPATGDWQVQVNDPQYSSSVQLQYDLVTFQQELVTPNSSQYTWQSVPVAPHLFFVDNAQQKETLKLDPAYPMTVVASMTDPAGVKREIALTPNTNSALLEAQFAGTFIPLQAGDYTVELVGTVPNATAPSGSGVYTPLDTYTALDRDKISIKPAEVVIDVDAELKRLGSNWVEGNPVGICVTVRDIQTKKAIPNLNALRVEAVLHGPTGKDTIGKLTASTDPTAPCSYQGRVTPTEAGKLGVLARGYIPKPDGSAGELEVFNQSTPSYIMNVQVPKSVILTITRAVPVSGTPAPGAASQPLDSPLLIESAPWLPVQPLRLLVTATDENGAPLDIAALAGVGGVPEAQPLKVSILDGDGKQDLTGANSLHKLSGSAYELVTYDYGPGNYRVRVTGKPLDSNACLCSYVPHADGTFQNSVERAVQRPLVTGPILLGWLVTLLGLAVLGLIGRQVIVWGGDQLKNPLSGMLVIILETRDEQDNPSAVPYRFNLAGRRNRKTITGKELSAAMPALRKIYITNDGDTAMAEAGRVRATFYFAPAVKRKELTIPLTKDAPEVQIIEHGGITYYAVKDPGSASN